MKFSVVTLCFNQAAFVRQAIDSVLGQTGVDLEYIVLDPGSTDGSREIIRQYGPALSAVILEPDSGPAMGLNKSLARCTGDVFYYLNADDFALPGAFRRATRIFDTSKADVVCGGGFIVDQGGRPLKRMRSDTFTLRNYAFGASFILQQATFIRRAAIQRAGGFNEANHTCWDGELMVDLCLHGATIHSCAEPLGCFRIHPDSVTGSQRSASLYQSDRKRIFEKIMRRPESPADRAGMHLGRLWRVARNPAVLADKLTRGQRLEKAFRYALAEPGGQV